MDFDKENINVVVYNDQISNMSSAFTVWYYYYTRFGKERASKLKFMPSDDVVTSLRYLNDKNVMSVAGKIDAISKISRVASGFMQIEKVESVWRYFFPDTCLPQLFNRMTDPNFMIDFREKMYHFEEWNEILFSENEERIIECQINSTLIKNDAVHIIQEIDSKYWYVVYAQHEYLKNDVTLLLETAYPVADIFVTYNYDQYKDATTFCVRSSDIKRIEKDHVGMAIEGAYWMKLNGKLDLLPYRTINDLDFLKCMRRCENGTITVKKDEMTYTLFSVVEIREEWIETDFMYFLKRKNSASQLLVFERPSDETKYDEEQHVMIPLKDYAIIHNERAAKDGLSNLHFALCNNEYMLCITSEREFANVFQQTKR